jgi:hypothetical protein
VRIARDTGQQPGAGEASGSSAYLAAVSGQEERRRRLLDAALDEPAGHLATAAGTWAHWALGLLGLARGRPVDALSQIRDDYPRTGALPRIGPALHP